VFEGLANAPALGQEIGIGQLTKIVLFCALRLRHGIWPIVNISGGIPGPVKRRRPGPGM
jgi:hypothetical protein